MSKVKNIQVCEDGVSSLECTHYIGLVATTSSSLSYSDPHCENSGGFEFLTPLPVDLYKYLYQQKFRHLEKAIHTLVMIKGLWFKQEHQFAANKQTIISIAELTNQSEPTIRRHIAQLKANNLIKKRNKHYFPCSTEKLMAFLGCDTPKLKKFQDGKARFKTAYISLEAFNKNPQKNIEDVFLKRLEKQQLYIIRKKVSKILKTCNVKSKAKKTFKKSTKTSMIDYVINPKKYPHVSKYHTMLIPNEVSTLVKHIQTDVVLSCKAMAERFNRKAIQTGANKLKRCSVTRKRRLKSTGVKFKNRNELFNFRMANKGHFVGFKGVIFESLTSSFYSNLNELEYSSGLRNEAFDLSYSKN
jgi:hypothetical protein